MSVNDFAKITRTTSATLRYYDSIGLLSPMVRGDNKYRYYSMKQLSLCNAIRFLQKIGVPISELQSLSRHRTPELAKQLVIQKIAELKTKREKLDNEHRILNTMLQSIQSGLDADEQAIEVRFFPSAPIILGEPNDYSGGKTDYDALRDFYHAMHDKCADAEYGMHYPVWAVFSQERIINGDWRYPDRYYFFNPGGKDQRPAAMYAIGHMRTGYGQAATLYRQMISYIAKNGFEVCGNAYEEYPINEICSTDDTNYLLRLMITVREV